MRDVLDLIELARNMVQSPDNWPPMRVKAVAQAFLSEAAAREADRRRIADLEDFLKGAAKQFNAMAAPGASREAASVGEANTTTKELTDG